MDRLGNIYVADSSNSRIQKFTPDGQLLAVWGSSGTDPGQFNYPTGIGVDGDSNIYVAEAGNSRVQKLSPDGQSLAVWGATSNDPSVSVLVGQFSRPYSLAVDSHNNVYVAGSLNNRIQKLTVAGCGGAAQGARPVAEATLLPIAVANDPSAQPDSSQAAPDALSDGVRADILAAVDRANAAWAAASASLEPSGLSAVVAGQELTSDLAELDKLRRLRQTRKNINTEFAITDVTLDAPGHAVVRTRETWSAELYDMATGRLIQRIPATTYAETYTVEYLNGGWIVMKNDV